MLICRCAAPACSSMVENDCVLLSVLVAVGMEPYEYQGCATAPSWVLFVAESMSFSAFYRHFLLVYVRVGNLGQRSTRCCCIKPCGSETWACTLAIASQVSCRLHACVYIVLQQSSRPDAISAALSHGFSQWPIKIMSVLLPAGRDGPQRLQPFQQGDPRRVQPLRCLTAANTADAGLHIGCHICKFH